MNLNGLSLIAGRAAGGGKKSFICTTAGSGNVLPPAYFCATTEDIDSAVAAAGEAFHIFSRIPGMRRAELLRNLAMNLSRQSQTIVARAKAETALSEVRLHGELSRATNQLQIFAHQLEEGSWLQARIDTSDPGRKPNPKPDVRSLMRPLGPVAIFGAGNFPLAFSVAGGDTASALAAGCPVIAKAHSDHPGTDELVGQILCRTLADVGLPGGVFSVLFDDSHDIGRQLVQHRGIRAVAFTGSRQGGMAIAQVAAERSEPIPVFAQMSSINPVFLLPGAMSRSGASIAAALAHAMNLSTGQFCTKPGVVFVPDGADGSLFTAALLERAAAIAPAPMFSSATAARYRQQIAERLSAMGMARLNYNPESPTATSTWVSPVILQTDAEHFLHQAALEDEIFGPALLLVTYRGIGQLVSIAENLSGQLAASVYGTPEDLSQNIDLLGLLEQRAGRLVFNGTPTRVEVCNAMVHGGPFPATNLDRHTAVGSAAIFRFVRPMAYQDAPQAQLPDELKDENPLGILRLVNGAITSATVQSR